MVDEILRTYKQAIGAVTLLPSSGGVFVVSRDGEMIFSKADQGRFPHPGELVELLSDLAN